MALIQKNNCVGVDCVIKRIQDYIWDNVSWNKTPFTENNYNSYQRAYENESNKPKLWEVFKNNSNSDYQDVMYNDNYLATSFFIVGNDVTVENGLQLADISIIFQIDVKSLYPTITHRADEEAHQEIANIINTSAWSPYFSTIKKGIRNVYSELGYGAEQFEDLQPYHVFRINLTNVKIDC